VKRCIVRRHKVADLDQLAPGELMGVQVEGKRICLARLHDGSVRAINDVCTHEEAYLSEGELWEEDVQCPQHGSMFNIRTGEVTGLPAQIPTETYPVVIEEGDVYVELD
jgi:3-phenylpropionate/trans-cinnamate dioxygenase ferredoxin subunit